MRLFESIIAANHRAAAGDATASVCPADFPDELPVIALTCVDPRLNALFPSVLGLTGDKFIWLRNAGNIITGPLSSTMRSLALACAVKGGREIAIIGHTDCQVARTTTVQLLEKLKALGVDRHLLPENINEYFGMFGSEPQNVVKACDIARQSPLIGPKIPVHGLLVDVRTGKLDWIVNGYQIWEKMSTRPEDMARSSGLNVDAMKALPDFTMGDMKFPETKIGETVSSERDWLARKLGQLGANEPAPAAPPPMPAPLAPPVAPMAPTHAQKLDAPPVIRPRLTMRKGRE